VTTPRTLEKRFLGALLGLAIGDALGMPVADLTVEQARERFGEIRGYETRNAGQDDAIPAGEITEETETVLCIAESITANNGRVDAENINVRMLYLAEGPSRHWMPGAMADGIEAAFPHDGQLPERDDPDGSLAVAVRGLPIGLVHSVGGFDPATVVEESRIVTRTSHPGVAQHQLTLDVALGIAGIVREEAIDPIELGADMSGIADERAMIADLLRAATSGAAFETVVFDAVNSLRPADSAGAVAGAFAGAVAGASGIPQGLIDGLEARVYLSLAAPWLYKTAARRAGTLIDLRQA
jgi:ADP-ribosylglycohydrolase